MNFLIQVLNECSGSRGKGGFKLHKGNWKNAAISKKSPPQVRDMCYSITMKNATATRILNPHNGAVLATFKYNHPNIVITTYQSKQFERLVGMDSEAEEKRDNQAEPVARVKCEFKYSSHCISSRGRIYSRCRDCGAL